MPSESEGIERSNIRDLGGWHSQTHLNEEASFKPLTDRIFQAGQRVSAHLGYDPKMHLKISSMWSIINPPRSSNKAHIHAGALWSGVYYVQTPENSGDLEFSDPRTAHVMTEARFDPDKTRARDNWTKVHFQPKAGKMVIFPSWLYHSVGPNLSVAKGKDSDRVIAPSTGTCTVGTTSTCTGDLAAGIDADDTGVPTLDTLIVNGSINRTTDGDGINFDRSTAGDLTITSSGEITVNRLTGVERATGIEATNRFGVGDISINSTSDITVEGLAAAEIDGHAAISVSKRGNDGDVDVDSQGKLSTASGSGIDVFSTSSGGDTTIKSVGDIDVGAGRGLNIGSGIVARGFSVGSGNISISSTGNLETDGFGIFADNISSSGDITITSEGDIISNDISATLLNPNNAVDADAIQVRVGIGNTATINLNGTSTVQGGTGDRAAVNFNGAASSTGVLNTSGTTTLSSLSANAILGGDGDDTINNSSTLTIIAGNKIDLGGGTNAFNNLGGGVFAVAGDIDNIDTFSNAGTFNIGSGQELTTTTFTQSNGKLTLNGTLNATTLVNGGTLDGSGILNGNVTANSGGSIAPGNSIGTQTVNGNFTLNAGSTLVIEVSAGPVADQVDVTGQVSVNGANLQLDDLGTPSQDFNQEIVIVNNDGNDAVSGTGFANVIDNLAFLAAEVTLTGGDGNDIALNLTESEVDFSTVAVTPNQTATGAGLNSIDPNNSEIQPLLEVFQPWTFEQAEAGLNSLTGEAFGVANFSVNTSALFVADSVTNGLNDFTTTNDRQTRAVQALALAPRERAKRLFAADLALDKEGASSQPRNKYVFSRALFRDVEIDADGNGSQTDIQNHGFIAGGGANFNEHFTAGFGVGYLRTEIEVNAVGSEVESDSAILNAHARFKKGNVDFTSNFGYLFTQADSERQVVIGALNQTASASFDSHTFFGDAEIGYTAELSNSFALRPFASAAFSITNREGFNETGAGAANLAVNSTTDTLGQFTVGLSATSTFSVRNTIIAPRIETAFDYLAGDVTPATTATFQPGGCLSRPLEQHRAEPEHASTPEWPHNLRKT